MTSLYPTYQFIKNNHVQCKDAKIKLFKLLMYLLFEMKYFKILNDLQFSYRFELKKKKCIHYSIGM